MPRNRARSRCASSCTTLRRTLNTSVALVVWANRDGRREPGNEEGFTFGFRLRGLAWPRTGFMIRRALGWRTVFREVESLAALLRKWVWGCVEGSGDQRRWRWDVLRCGVGNGSHRRRAGPGAALVVMECSRRHGSAEIRRSNRA